MDMRSTSSTLLAVLALSGATCFGSGGAMAQGPSPHEIPQSQIIEHEDNLEHLATLAGRPGPVGEIARRAVLLFKQHNAREREYILPPLTLLPYIVDGKVTPDMQWALDMTDRVKADREVIFDEHARMIEVLNELQFAGQQAHDAEAVEFAKGAAVDALNDSEILEPTVVLIGDVLRARLAPSH
jgi:hypothetical protein